MTPIPPPEELLEHLHEARSVLITGHINPDGDSIGSALALADVLTAVGKVARVWNRDPTPSIYEILPGAGTIHVGSVPPQGFPDSTDVVVAIECPTLDRSGLEEQLSIRPVLNVDHHLGNTRHGLVNWVDAEAPALGEMILHLARRLGVEPGPDTADKLLVALSSDTGGFRFANSTPRAFEAAAELVRQGADPTRVAVWLYERRPEASVRLLGEMLRSLEVRAEHGIASALLTREMFSRSSSSAAHAEGLIDVPRSIEGVVVVVLVRELENGKCKVSLRSRGDLNVEAIARGYGGGGHRNASGFVLQGLPEVVRDKTLRELLRRMGESAT